MKRKLNINDLMKLSVFEKRALVQILLQSIGLPKKKERQSGTLKSRPLMVQEQVVAYEVKQSIASKAEKRAELLSFRKGKKVKKNGFMSLAGIWKNRDITLELLRSRSWKPQN